MEEVEEEGMVEVNDTVFGSDHSLYFVTYSSETKKPCHLIFNNTNSYMYQTFFVLSFLRKFTNLTFFALM